MGIVYVPKLGQNFEYTLLYLMQYGILKGHQTVALLDRVFVQGSNQGLNCLPPATNQTSTCHIKSCVDTCCGQSGF